VCYSLVFRVEIIHVLNVTALEILVHLLTEGQFMLHDMLHDY
jgi:hypothetical protein